MPVFTILLVLIVLLLLAGIKIINQYERGLVLTLGSYTGTVSPGLRIVVPIIQRLIKVDMRINTADIPKQEVITKDNVPVGINAVVYFQVIRPEDAILKIQDFAYAITQYAQTALRDVIGGVELDTLLAEREKVAEEIKAIVDKETAEWGVDVTAIKMQDMELPDDMKRVMAKQAEAERERRATVIRAQGELLASKNLKEAMENMASSGAISLRTLQTIEASSSSQGNTIIFTLPTEILAGLKQLIK
ncbi:MAG: slipin family protein [Patescibacteria group bacterium]|nr:slipin family protein [Patescibacteria group bacterium]